MRNRPVSSQRALGLDPAEIERVLGRRVPADIVDWFLSCNGVEFRPGQIQDDAALIPGYEPISLHDAISIRDTLGDVDPILGEWWIPLLATGGGDFYAAVFEERLDQVFIASVMNGGVSRKAYHSIEEMVVSFCDLYRRGVFFVNDEGILDADDESWIQAELPLSGE
jgi:hypothetical protein